MTPAEDQDSTSHPPESRDRTFGSFRTSFPLLSLPMDVADEKRIVVRVSEQREAPVRKLDPDLMRLARVQHTIISLCSTNLQRSWKGIGFT